jgi:hypothetical protein
LLWRLPRSVSGRWLGCADRAVANPRASPRTSIRFGDTGTAGTLLLLLFALGITTYLPELSLWPPRQIYGHHPISIGTTPTNHKAT